MIDGNTGWFALQGTEAVPNEVDISFLRTRFEGVSTPKIMRAIDQVIDLVQTENPGLSPIEFYTELTNYLPGKMLEEENRRILRESIFMDGMMARDCFVFLNLKTILSVASRYYTYDPDLWIDGEPPSAEDMSFNSELVQACITGVYGLLDEWGNSPHESNTFLNSDNFVSANLNYAVHAIIHRYAAEELHLPVDLLLEHSEKMVLSDRNPLQEVLDYIDFHPLGVSNKMEEDKESTELKRFIRRMVHVYGMASGELTDFLLQYNSEISLASVPSVERQEELNEYPLEEVFQDLIQDRDIVTMREEEVMEKFLEGKNLEEIGKEFGVTRDRIGQYYFKVIRKFKHPVTAAKLITHYKGEEPPLGWSVVKELERVLEISQRKSEIEARRKLPPIPPFVDIRSLELDEQILIKLPTPLSLQDSTRYDRQNLIDRGFSDTEIMRLRTSIADFLSKFEYDDSVEKYYLWYRTLSADYIRFDYSFKLEDFGLDREVEEKLRSMGINSMRGLLKYGLVRNELTADETFHLIERYEDIETKTNPGPAVTAMRELILDLVGNTDMERFFQDRAIGMLKKAGVKTFGDVISLLDNIQRINPSQIEDVDSFYEILSTIDRTVSRYYGEVEAEIVKSKIKRVQQRL